MARSDLEVAIRRQDGAVILDLIGDVDATAETALQRAYDAAAADSRAVVGVHQQVLARGGEIAGDVDHAGVGREPADREGIRHP